MFKFQLQIIQCTAVYMSNWLEVSEALVWKRLVVFISHNTALKQNPLLHTPSRRVSDLGKCMKSARHYFPSPRTHTATSLRIELRQLDNNDVCKSRPIDSLTASALSHEF